MLIALVRHGQASDHAIDRERQLTDHGQNQAKQAGDFLKASRFTAKRLIHSPLVRAKQTCDLIKEAYLQTAQTIESGELKPESSLSFWLHQLNEEQEELVLVGHNPYLSMMAQELTDSPLNFPTGGCLILERTRESDLWKVVSKNF